MKESKPYSKDWQEKGGPGTVGSDEERIKELEEKLTKALNLHADKVGELEARHKLRVKEKTLLQTKVANLETKERKLEAQLKKMKELAEDRIRVIERQREKLPSKAEAELIKDLLVKERKTAAFVLEYRLKIEELLKRVEKWI